MGITRARAKRDSIAPQFQVVEEPGSSALKTSNQRKVYDAKGKLLFDTFMPAAVLRALYGAAGLPG